MEIFCFLKGMFDKNSESLQPLFYHLTCYYLCTPKNKNNGS